MISHVIRRVNTVYEILGTTNKLTEAQMRNIIAGRKRIVELARRNPGEMYVNGPTSEKRVALTFDDGPDSIVTPKVLDILNSYNVKGNFFFIGTQVDYFPGIVTRTFNEGHLVLSHSLNHPHFSQMGEQGIKNQITSTGEKIKGIIGKRPSMIRPPYGETDDRVLAAARETKNKVIIWSTDSMDWVPRIGRQAVVQNVLGNVRPGEIIAMHSGYGQRVVLEALGEIIKGLIARGFSIVDLETLLGVSAYS